MLLILIFPQLLLATSTNLDVCLKNGESFSCRLFSSEIKITRRDDHLYLNNNGSEKIIEICSSKEKNSVDMFLNTLEVSFIPEEMKLFSIDIKTMQIGQSGSGAGCFFNPTFITVDPLEHIYISDSGNDRIQILDSNGVYLNQFGSFGVSDFEEGNENEISDSPKQATFNFPSGIAIATEIFVSDRDNHRIMKFDRFGNYLRSFGKFGTGDTEFDTPMGLDMDSLKNLYVADSQNHRVKKYDLNGYMILKFGGFGKAPGRFIRPLSITHDNMNKIYVFDSGNKRIQKFDRTGGFLKVGPLIENIDSKYVHDIHCINNIILIGEKNILYLYSLDLEYLGKYNLTGIREIYGISSTENHIVLSDISSGKLVFVKYECKNLTYFNK